MTAFWKDIGREITYSLGRFFGILTIVALGAAFFAGIGSTGRDMKMTGEQYYKKQNLMDIQVHSTIGLNQKDIDSIQDIAGILDVFPSFSMDGLVSHLDKSVIVKAHGLDISRSYKEQMNKPRLLSGFIPRNSREVLVDPKFALLTGLEIGDEFIFQSGQDRDSRNSLKTNRFQIVGISESPLYLTMERGTGNVGSGQVDCFIYIPMDNFTSHLYTEAYIRLENTEDLVFDDKTYEDLVDSQIKAIEAVGTDRIIIRQVELISDKYKKIDDATKNITKEERQLSIILGDSKNELIRMEAQLKKEKRKLQTDENQLNQGLEDIKSLIKEVREGLSLVENTIISLINDKNSLDTDREELDKLAAFISPQGYAAATEQINSGLQLLNQTMENMYAEEHVLRESILDIEASQKAMGDTDSKIQGAFLAIGSERRKIEEAIKDIADEEMLAKNHIAAGRRDLEEAKDVLDDVLEPFWYVNSRQGIIGYASYEDDAGKITALGRVFPLVFYIVGALVSLTTITRLVDERRTEMGTLKALGYSSGVILSKYLIYAILPTTIGGIIGGYIGMKTLPGFIIDAYNMLYNIPDALTPIQGDFWIVSVLMGVMSTTIAAIFSVYKELSEVSAELMRPKAPKAGKRNILEKIPLIWSQFNFTQKVTLRNLFRYKKRFIMTIAGIGGCTALIMTGFGIKDSISDIIAIQFGEIFRYNMNISMADGATEKDLSNIEGFLQSSSEIAGSFPVRHKIIDALEVSGEAISVSLLVTKNTDNMDIFFVLQDRITKIPMGLDDSGVIITEKLADLLSLAVGDNITIDYNNQLMDLPITGISEQYFMHFIYMDGALYEQIYHEPPAINSIYTVFSTDESPAIQLVTEEILSYKNVAQASFVSTMIEEFEDVIGTLNFVVYILIGAAALLAFVVLLNLTNINITERERELATIKVLGFYDTEVEDYIYRENIIMTGIGIVVGFGLGILLHRYVIATVEVDNMMFGKNIAFVSYVYSAVLTGLFSFIVNKITRHKLHDIDMVEALKSSE